ncbi:MAG: hypothetical protein CVV05_00390 [Gammaproteobacteria bacterium HGW-Gammaproteobacteria-1]|jgi:very-short-patch-repair endonuclease|nr:MAG: hypothetical protein CVV05_00390 [Gammaproteobacteria bacterium HGW-Gammaproteobacteria-1]
MVRLSTREALARGLIDDAEARRIERARLARRHQRAYASDSPQSVLQRVVCARWPDEAVSEYVGAVPWRRFRLDVAFPAIRLCIEVDGWEHHGRFKSDFKRDRDRVRLLQVCGWRVFPFYASEILRDTGYVLEMIAEMREVLLREAVARGDINSGDMTRGSGRHG